MPDDSAVGGDQPGRQYALSLHGGHLGQRQDRDQSDRVQYGRQGIAPDDSDLGQRPPDGAQAGGRLLIWDRVRGKSDPTAYLVNPATRTKTTLRLHGIPRAQYLTLAW